MAISPQRLTIYLYTLCSEKTPTHIFFHISVNDKWICDSTAFLLCLIWHCITIQCWNWPKRTVASRLKRLSHLIWFAFCFFSEDVVCKTKRRNQLTTRCSGIFQQLYLHVTLIRSCYYVYIFHVCPFCPVEMFEILPMHWNLKQIFTHKWASVDMNWGNSLPNLRAIPTLIRSIKDSHITRRRRCVSCTWLDADRRQLEVAFSTGQLLLALLLLAMT